ncbi:MAG: SIR2 family protein [Flavobacteriaceae bacterium]|nr:SIR2 family protein [Flavobacteriaceae bacterium]
MEIDALLKLIQDWTNRVPLIILGSGASVPFRLPSMWTLGEHLKSSISFTDPEDIKQFEIFKETLNKVKDLESTLLQIQLRPNVLEKIIYETWSLVNRHDVEAFEQLLEGKTEFPLAELTTHLLQSAQRKVSIVTTNYDRLAEYAASFSNAFICTGFSQNFIGHFSKSIHQQDLTKLSGFKGQVNIWKVHGSLDWFKSEEESDRQLPYRTTIPVNHKPLIVTPGLSKYYETQLEPFRTIFTEADNEIEKATSYLCIGYGFNDIHVQPKLLAQIKSGKPIIVITKELTPKTKQSIIDARCKQYILIEEANGKDTRVYSSSFSGEQIIPGVNYWSLSEYLNLIKN